MHTKLTDLIKTYPSVLPDSLCQELVRLYEKADNKKYHSRDISQYEQVWMRPEPELFALQSIVYKHLAPCVHDYMLSLSDVAMFPKKFEFESYKIKKYNKGDYFHKHVDADNDPRRMLSVSVYLTDNGGTDFFDGFVVGGEAGSVLIFPPLWMFPHAAVINGDGKYFLNTYLIYA